MPVQKRSTASRKTKRSTTKLKGKSGFFSGRRNIMIVAVLVIVGVALLLKTFAATPGVWSPTGDAPITYAWMLDGEVTPAAVQKQDTSLLQLTNLQGTAIPAAKVIDIDGFNNSAADVAALHGAGYKVVCYIDTGVWEAGRPDDGDFPGASKYVSTKPDPGSPATLPQYAGVNILGNPDQNNGDGGNWSSGGHPNLYMDVANQGAILPIEYKRIDMCKQKGFDAIEPDEMDDYSNSPGFADVTYAAQVSYNKAIAAYAHGSANSLAPISIGMKDDIEQSKDLAGSFDWVLNEECYEYSECTSSDNGGGLTNFKQANKAVWVAEYPGDVDWSKSQLDSSTPSRMAAATYNAICSDSATNHFNTAFYVSGLPSGTGNKGGRTDCNVSWGSGGGGGGTPVQNPTITLANTSQANLTAPATVSLSATSNPASAITITNTATNATVATCATNTVCNYTASYPTAGTYTFKATGLIASTGGAGASTVVSVTVAPGQAPPPVNHAPSVSGLTANPTTVTQPASFKLSSNATDPDTGDTLTVNYYKSSDNTLAASSKQSPYSVTLSGYTQGTYSFYAVATDSHGASSAKSAAVTETVNPPVAPPPVLPAAPAFSGANFSYQWWQGGGCNATSNCAMTVSWTPVPAATSYKVSVNGNAPTSSVVSNYTLKPINSGYNYTFQVSSVNSAGASTPTSLTKSVSCVWIFCSLN